MQQSPSSLFREEVLRPNDKNAFGSIVLINPISHQLIVLMIGTLLVIFIAFICFGSYTRRVTINGVLEPTAGVIKLFAPQNGVVRQQSVREGQLVKKGDILFVFASEHENERGLAMESEIMATIRQRLDALKRELNSTQDIARSDLVTLRANSESLQQGKANLVAQIETQQKRVDSAQTILDGFLSLQSSGFAPELLVQQRRADVYDQQLKLQTLKKSLVDLNAELDRTREQISQAAPKLDMAQASVERTIAMTNGELSQRESEQTWSVVAPCECLVSALSITSNQTTGTVEPIATLTPANSPISAKVYAASKALGFVAVGQPVRLKLDAFAFQKFGFVTGRVEAISDVSNLPSELAPATRLGFAQAPDSREPLYQITIGLDQQSIDVYGHATRLRPGLQVTADIEVEERQLYEWIAEPLLALGKQ
jgi:membrane fusion protein